MPSSVNKRLLSGLSGMQKTVWANCLKKEENGCKKVSCIFPMELRLKRLDYQSIFGKFFVLENCFSKFEV